MPPLAVWSRSTYGFSPSSGRIETTTGVARGSVGEHARATGASGGGVTSATFGPSVGAASASPSASSIAGGAPVSAPSPVPSPLPLDGAPQWTQKRNAARTPNECVRMVPAMYGRAGVPARDKLLNFG